MSPQLDLLWTWAALLLLLLVAAAGLCVRCSSLGGKTRTSQKIYEQRNLQEDQQSFAGGRTYSLVRQSWPGSLQDKAQTRKDKLLQFSPSMDGSASPRYQNFRKGSRHGSDTSYIDPITSDYYNWGGFQKPLEGEENSSNDYQNFLICRPTPVESCGPGEAPGGEGSDDYQNVDSIQQWRLSRKAGAPGPEDQFQKVASRRPPELTPADGPPSREGSDQENSSEPDYVNGDVEVAGN